MHDLKYANSILLALKHNADAKNRSAYVVVNVRLSPFSHVRPEGLEETFRLLAENEGYGHVKLKIGTLEFSLSCKECGKVSRHGEPVFECPHCKGYNFDIEKANEFCVDSIEVK